MEIKISNDKNLKYSIEDKFSEKITDKAPKNNFGILNEIKSSGTKNTNGLIKNKVSKKIDTNEKKNSTINKEKMLSSFFLKQASENNENERINTRDNYINIIKNISSGSRENSVFEKSFLKKSTSQFNFMKKKKGSLDNLDISNIRSTNNKSFKVNQSQSPKIVKPIKEVEVIADKKFAIFEKIYSFNSEFVKKLRNEKNKKFTNLQDYQTNIVKIISEKASMENLRVLSQQLNNIKEISESSAKIGKTDWKLYNKIINDCKSSMKALRRKRFNESEFASDIAHFQKDLGLASKKKLPIGKRFCKYETSLKRISPFIPEYLVEKFKNTLKIIN
jgi:hypothetical protein